MSSELKTVLNADTGTVPGSRCFQVQHSEITVKQKTESTRLVVGCWSTKKGWMIVILGFSLVGCLLIPTDSMIAVHSK